MYTTIHDSIVLVENLIGCKKNIKNYLCQNISFHCHPACR